MGAGIILAVTGFVSLPFVMGTDSHVALNSAFPFLANQGIFSKPGLLLLAVGGSFCVIASLLPKK